MIKAALQYLIDLGKVETLEIEEQQYSTTPLYHIKHPSPAAIEVQSLTALVDYVESEFDYTYGKSVGAMMVHVEAHDSVKLLSQLYATGQRHTYMSAKAFIPEFRFSQWHSLETFNVHLQSCFLRTDDTDKILRVVGNIKDSTIRQFGDDGVTQQVTAKTGLASVEDVAVPNPVILVPYRTFLEVEQPLSRFVFRMRQGPNGPECALFEADGGAWQLEAMSWVKAYLVKNLEGSNIPVIG